MTQQSAQFSSNVVGKQRTQKALSDTCAVNARKYTIVTVAATLTIIEKVEVECGYE